jgi:hypothetical protein
VSVSEWISNADEDDVCALLSGIVTVLVVKSGTIWSKVGVEKVSFEDVDEGANVVAVGDEEDDGMYALLSVGVGILGVFVDINGTSDVLEEGKHLPESFEQEQREEVGDWEEEVEEEGGEGEGEGEGDGEPEEGEGVREEEDEMDKISCIFSSFKGSEGDKGETLVSNDGCCKWCEWWCIKCCKCVDNDNVVDK